jgi:tetratricopeptide (TPR) repeat protein
MPLCRELVVVVLVLLLPCAAQAQVDPDTEIARRHFKTGSVLYDEGNYEKAREEFEAARRVRPLPAFDFNIARCLDRLERPREAIAAYERYLQSNPEDADAVRERVQMLRSRLPVEPAVKPAAPSAAAISVAAPPPKPLARKAWFWGVMAGTAVVVAGAIALGVVLGTADSDSHLPAVRF